MKFGQLTEYNKRNHSENETVRLVPDVFLFFKKSLFEVKASALRFNIEYKRIVKL